MRGLLMAFLSSDFAGLAARTLARGPHTRKPTPAKTTARAV